MTQAHPPGVDVAALPANGNPKCACVKTHSPVPYEDEGHHIIPTGQPFGGDPDGELVWLCPTTHSAVHGAIRMLLKAWRSGADAPDLRHVGRYARELAHRAMDHLHAKELPP